MKTYSGNKWINRPFFFRGKWNFTSWHRVSTPMKGGHTHNHCSNRQLKYIHTKAERKYLRKFLKKKLEET